MQNPPFIDDHPIKTFLLREFPIATFDDKGGYLMVVPLDSEEKKMRCS
jgi:hypothetical protein